MSNNVEIRGRLRERFDAIKSELKAADPDLPEPTDSYTLSMLMDTWEAAGNGYYTADEPDLEANRPDEPDLVELLELSGLGPSEAEIVALKLDVATVPEIAAELEMPKEMIHRRALTARRSIKMARGLADATEGLWTTGTYPEEGENDG